MDYQKCADQLGNADCDEDMTRKCFVYYFCVYLVSLYVSLCSLSVISNFCLEFQKWHKFQISLKRYTFCSFYWIILIFFLPKKYYSYSTTRSTAGMRAVDFMNNCNWMYCYILQQSAFCRRVSLFGGGVSGIFTNISTITWSAVSNAAECYVAVMTHLFLVVYNFFKPPPELLLFFVVLKCYNNPCAHGGTCIELLSQNTYQCSCPPQFGGQNCEKGKYKSATPIHHILGYNSIIFSVVYTEHVSTLSIRTFILTI